MNLIIDNKIIQEPIINILNQLKTESNWDVFSTMQPKQDYVVATCPFHKDGKEKKPSFSVYTSYDSDSVMPGTYHCFTCNEKGSLVHLISYVLGISDDEAKKWLIDRYGDLYYTHGRELPDMDFGEDEVTVNYLDESILNQYRYYHPYAEKRNISFDIAKQFLVGYNNKRNTVTFPVWDEHGGLVMITERSVIGKKFFIPTGVEKPVYLLNYVVSHRCNPVVVVEGQIDALVAWSYGVPAVALFGCGTTDHQIELLNSSGIRDFILMYDNDYAGRKGAERFQKYVKNSFITDIVMPKGKDVGSCTKDEFYDILRNNELDFIIPTSK